MQQRFRELKERKFIKKDYPQNIFSSAQSCKQQFEKVGLGFFLVLLDYIYTTLCKQWWERKNYGCDNRTGCQVTTQKARSLQAVVRCTKMYIRCNILTSEKITTSGKSLVPGVPNKPACTAHAYAYMHAKYMSILSQKPLNWWLWDKVVTETKISKTLPAPAQDARVHIHQKADEAWKANTKRQISQRHEYLSQRTNGAKSVLIS